MPTILDETIGSIFVGVLISAVLWGAGALQAFNYFTSRQNDSIYVKAAVLIALITDTIHQALISNILYDYTITHFGDIIFLLKIQSSLPAQIVLQQLTGTIVQSFFAYRIFRLSERSPFFIVPVIISILLQLCGGIVYAVKTARITTYAQLNELTTPSYIYAVFVVVADLLIASMLTFLLQRARGRPSTRSQDPMKARIDNTVQQLIVLTMTNGLLCSICAIGVFFSYVALSAGSVTFAYVPFFFIAGRLYFNSLLAALNMRTYSRNKIIPPAPIQVSASNTLSPHHGPRSAKMMDLAQVDVDVVTHLDHDMELAISSVSRPNSHTIQDITTRATASGYGDAFFQEATLVDNEVNSGTDSGLHSAVSSRKQVGSPSTRSWVGPRPRNPSKGMSESSLSRVPEANPAAPVNEYSPTLPRRSAEMKMATKQMDIPAETRTPLPQAAYSPPVPQSSHTSPVRALPTPSPSGVKGRVSRHEPQHESGISPTCAIRPLPVLPGVGRR